MQNDPLSAAHTGMRIAPRIMHARLSPKERCPPNVGAARSNPFGRATRVKGCLEGRAIAPRFMFFRLAALCADSFPAITRHGAINSWSRCCSQAYVLTPGPIVA